MPLYRDLIRRLAMIGLAILLVAFAAKYFFTILSNLQIRNIWFNDFFAIWSFAKFPISNHAADIYDHAVLQKFQELLGSTSSIHLPFAYPPSFLLLLIPLGTLGYYAAYGVWILGTLVFYYAVSWHRNWNRSTTLLIIFAPATILNFVYGQTGFLTSALMVGGFRYAVSRPLLSGALLGLVSIKPQLGILIPIALISARLWRTLAAAGVTLLVLVLVSSAALGWWIWPLWLSRLFAHADWVSLAKPQYMPTIIGNLTFLGVDLSTARLIQLTVSGAVAGIIWACFRRGVTTLGVAALFVGTFLATPYAFVYDMPMLTNAILAVIDQQKKPHLRLPIGEISILVLSLILPLLIVETWRLGAVKSIPLILLFGLIVRHMMASRRGGAVPGSASLEQPVGVC